MVTYYAWSFHYTATLCSELPAECPLPSSKFADCPRFTSACRYVGYHPESAFMREMMVFLPSAFPYALTEKQERTFPWLKITLRERRGCVSHWKAMCLKQTSYAIWTKLIAMRHIENRILRRTPATNGGGFGTNRYIWIGFCGRFYTCIWYKREIFQIMWEANHMCMPWFGQ